MLKGNIFAEIRVFVNTFSSSYSWVIEFLRKRSIGKKVNKTLSQLLAIAKAMLAQILS